MPRSNTANSRGATLQVCACFDTLISSAIEVTTCLYYIVFYWEESQAASPAGTHAWTHPREQHAAGGRGDGENPAQADHIPYSAAEVGRCATEVQAVRRHPAPAQLSSSRRRGGAGAGSIERRLLLAGRAEALQQCGLRGLVPREPVEQQLAPRPGNVLGWPKK